MGGVLEAGVASIDETSLRRGVAVLLLCVAINSSAAATTSAVAAATASTTTNSLQGVLRRIGHWNESANTSVDAAKIRTG